MRKLVLAVVMVMLAVSLVGCGKKAEEKSASSNEKRTVVLWSFAQNNVDEWKAREAAIEEKFNIDLQVELVAQNAFVQKLQAVMMDGKGAPDIIEWMIENNRILNAEPNKSFVEPLDEFVANSDVFSKVPKGRVDWVKYGGHVYGLPHDVHPVVLVYNDTLWKEAGVDMESIQTWDDFFEASKKLTSKKKDGKPVHYALPYGHDGLQNTMFMVWQQSGAQVLDANGKPQFDSPEFTEFTKKWMGWVETGAFTTWDWGNFAALLNNGTLASYTSPDWWIPQVNDAAASGKYEFKVRDLPLYSSNSPRTASWGGSFLAIPRGTEDPARIYKIMEYMQYDEASMTTRWKETGMLPPFQELWGQPAFNEPDDRFGGQKLGTVMGELAKEMPPINTGDVFWDALGDFTQQYTEIASGKITIEEGLANTQTKAMERYNK